MRAAPAAHLPPGGMDSGHRVSLGAPEIRPDSPKGRWQLGLRKMFFYEPRGTICWAQFENHAVSHTRLGEGLFTDDPRERGRG